MASILKYGWHEWLCKSNFSFLIGSSSPHELVEKAVDLTYGSLCINDFDGAYGLARGFRALKNLKEKKEISHFRLHYGVEIHLRKDHEKPILLQDTLALVAQSWEGYRNLCQIVTYSHREGKKDAFISLEDLLNFSVKDIVVIQPMRGMIRKNLNKDYFGKIKEHFAGRFYFAISRHLHHAEDYWIEPTIELSKSLGASCLLSQDVFFHSPCRKPLNDILHSIRHNLSVEEASLHFFPNCERYLQRIAALQARYCHLSIYEKALKDSYELSQTCQFDLGQLRYHYPKEMIPAQHTAQSFLEELTWHGAKERYGIFVPEKVAAILSHELEIIAKLNFADYFLTVWDIVRWARSQNILCQGRGSAANSAVCFILGITSVDPSHFELLFERFVSMERGDPPDIDVDFEHERREEVISYIYERYGRDKAAMVANVITFRKKGALRAVGKALGVCEQILSHVSRITETKYIRGRNLSEILEIARKNYRKENVGDYSELPWKLWGEMASLLIGFPRHLGIHSGGFMLSDKPLNWLIPQEPATMEGRSVVQWCKDDIEGLGFFKIDILCLGMLTAIRKTFSYLESYWGKKLSLHTIPQRDEKTYAMIQRADTVGTFQIESRAQMSMLPRLRPGCFYDLVIEIAIIRPGPIQGKVIHPFLKRREGKEPVTFPDEKLRPILARTLGVAIFQEQAMRIAIAVGNFTPGEADELRKSIGAWNIKTYDRDLNPWLQKLSEGMRKNGYKEDFIAQILGQMRGFADYGFPESHAISFALIAYASSYLKCYYPEAFFTGVLNSQPMGFYTPHTLLQAAQRAGVKILPICVNHSIWDHQLENVALFGREYGIRLGFRLVTSLSKKGAERLVEARKRLGGVFSSIDEILQNASLYRSDLTALACANAFKVFGLSRLEAIWKAEAAPFAPFIEEEEESLIWPYEDSFTSVKRDFSSFKTSLGPHPVVIIKKEAWSYSLSLAKVILAKQLANLHSGLIVDVFGMVFVKQAPPSAKGIVFLTLEDETGFINLVFKPDVYQHFYKQIERESFLCIKGRIQKAGESHSIVVSFIYERSERKAKVTPLFHDHEVRDREQNSDYTEADAMLIKPRNYM